MCPITQNQHIRMKLSITDALLDELLKNYNQSGDLLGPDGLLTELKKRLINRVFGDLDRRSVGLYLRPSAQSMV
jgi:hypothetical protein